MSQLANKYRPSTLSEVIGQEIIVIAIRYLMSHDLLPSTIVITGKYGTGKTTIARLIAKCINCQNPIGNITNKDACGLCECCIMISNGSCLDIIEIEAANNTGVDNVKKIILDSSIYINSSPCKIRVYIIDEAHMLSISACAALLKFAESDMTDMKCICIWATTERDKIPETILSRGISLQLNEITEEDIQSRLLYIARQENINITTSAIVLISQKSANVMRDAIMLLEQATMQILPHQQIDESIIYAIIKEPTKNDLLLLLIYCLNKQPHQALQHLQSFKNVTPHKLIVGMSEIVHELAVYCTTNQDLSQKSPNPSIENNPLLLQIIKLKMELALWLKIWQILINGARDIKAIAQQRNVLEMIILRICALFPNQLPNKIEQSWHSPSQDLLSQSSQQPSSDPHLLSSDTSDTNSNLSSADTSNTLTTSSLSKISLSEIELVSTELSKTKIENNNTTVDNDLNLIPSFSAFVNYFAIKREATLHYYLSNKIQCSSYEIQNKEIVITAVATEIIPAKVIKNITNKIREWTGFGIELLITKIDPNATPLAIHDIKFDIENINVKPNFASTSLESTLSKSNTNDKLVDQSHKNAIGNDNVNEITQDEKQTNQDKKDVLQYVLSTFPNSEIIK